MHCVVTASTSFPPYPQGSLTPTFAACAMHINNARWDGVPFLLKAGKALHTRRAEIRVQFRWGGGLEGTAAVGVCGSGARATQWVIRTGGAVGTLAWL